MIRRQLGIVYRKELLESLRDRRTLISMVVIPVFFMPFLILGMGFMAAKAVGKARKETARIMLIGAASAPRVVEAIKKVANLEVISESGDYTNRIVDKSIRAAVRIPADFEGALDRGEKTSLEILLYEGDFKSSFAVDKLNDTLRDFRLQTVETRLAARGLPKEVLEPFAIERKNVAPLKKVTGNMLGGLLPYTVILLCVLGAMYPAMDLTAGEKERGTLETILCSPIPRAQLVLGKFLTVLTTSLATAVLSLLSSAITFAAAKGAMMSLGAEAERKLALSFDLTSLAAVFVMVVPVAVFFSAAQLAIALFARNFKEAQTYLSPLMFLVIVPAMMSMLPGLELNVPLALVPVLNTSLVSKEMIGGNYPWPYIGLIFASSCVYAALALTLAVKLFNREEVIFRV